MGIETLQNAARAAGFAMAPADETTPEVSEEVKPETWRPSAALLPPEAYTPAKSETTVTEWVKSVFGATGRATA
jgi:hypothetical protein